MERFHAIRAAALLILVVTACGGSDGTGPDDGSHFYRFDANGTRVNYTLQTSLLATFSQAGNQYNAVITGFDGTSNSSVQILHNATIGTGTYNGYAVDIPTSTIKGVVMHYRDATGTLYQPKSPIADVVTITEMTAETVRGTFNGRLSANGKPDLVVTNGAFFVPRVN